MTATCKDRKWFAHRRHTLLPFDSAVSFLEFWSDPCKCCVSSIVLHSEMKYTSFRHFPLLECQRIFPFWCGVQQIFKMTKHHIIITVSHSSKMPNYIIMWLPPEGRNCLFFLFFFPLWSLDLCIFYYTIVSVSTITSTLKSRLLSKVMMMLETKQRKEGTIGKRDYSGNVNQMQLWKLASFKMSQRFKSLFKRFMSMSVHVQYYMFARRCT